MFQLAGLSQQDLNHLNVALLQYRFKLNGELAKAYEKNMQTHIDSWNQDVEDVLKLEQLVQAAGNASGMFQIFVVGDEPPAPEFARTIDGATRFVADRYATAVFKVQPGLWQGQSDRGELVVIREETFLEDYENHDDDGDLDEVSLDELCDDKTAEQTERFHEQLDLILNGDEPHPSLELLDTHIRAANIHFPPYRSRLLDIWLEQTNGNPWPLRGLELADDANWMPDTDVNEQQGPPEGPDEDDQDPQFSCEGDEPPHVYVATRSSGKPLVFKTVQESAIWVDKEGYDEYQIGIDDDREQFIHGVRSSDGATFEIHAVPFAL